MKERKYIARAQLRHNAHQAEITRVRGRKATPPADELGRELGVVVPSAPGRAGAWVSREQILALFGEAARKHKRTS